VADDRATLREVGRVLAPGGRAVIFVPNRLWPFETHGTVWRGRYRPGNAPFVNYLPDPVRNHLAPHVRVYTRHGLRGLVKGLPLAVVGYAVARLRPSAWTWPLIALAVFWPRTLGSLIVGNSDLLSAAFVAGGILWGWPGALGFYKPSLAPFGFAGARRRSWWVGLAVVVAVSIPFLVSGAWSQYLVAATHWDLPLDRQVLNIPILLIPVVAWLGRRDRSLSSTGTGEGAT